MSIAFQAVVIFVLALPGILFRECLSLSGPLRQKRGVADALVQSIGVSALIHLVCGSIANAFCGHLRIDVDSVLMLASGNYGHDDAQFTKAIKSISNHPIEVFSYFLFATLSGAGIGYSIRSALGRWGRTAIIDWLDDSPAARRFNDWVGVLNLSSVKSNALVVPFVGTVVNVGSESYLYTGVLRNVYPDDDGNPDRYELVSASRRPLRDDHGQHYDILGNVLILRASEITTLNVYMVSLAATENVGPVVPGDQVSKP